MQLLDKEKAVNVWGNKLRRNVCSRSRLERTHRSRCKAEAGGWQQQESANMLLNRDGKHGPTRKLTMVSKSGIEMM